jgi:hypothetical protein
MAYNGGKSDASRLQKINEDNLYGGTQGLRQRCLGDA